jgi:hypothetical protein
MAQIFVGGRMCGFGEPGMTFQGSPDTPLSVAATEAAKPLRII